MKDRDQYEESACPWRIIECFLERYEKIDHSVTAVS